MIYDEYSTEVCRGYIRLQGFKAFVSFRENTVKNSLPQSGVVGNMTWLISSTNDFFGKRPFVIRFNREARFKFASS